jgi:hypothetical protein
LVAFSFRKVRASRIAEPAMARKPSDQWMQKQTRM